LDIDLQRLLPTRPWPTQKRQIQQPPRNSHDIGIKTSPQVCRVNAVGSAILSKPHRRDRHRFFGSPSSEPSGCETIHFSLCNVDTLNPAATSPQLRIFSSPELSIDRWVSSEQHTLERRQPVGSVLQLHPLKSRFFE